MSESNLNKFCFISHFKWRLATACLWLEIRQEKPVSYIYALHGPLHSNSFSCLIQCSHSSQYSGKRWRKWRRTVKASVNCQANVIFGGLIFFLMAALFISSKKNADRFLVFLFILFFTARGIFSSKGSSSSGESSDSAAFQTKKEGACKLARKAGMFVFYHSRPQCLRFWFLAVMRKGALG